MNRSLVIVPTYNEIDNLQPLVSRTLVQPDLDVLVVDDGSPDGTGALADRLAGEHPEVNVIHRSAKDGLGGAYLTGFRWAIARGYENVVEMDADGSHHPEDLPRLLALLDSHDLAIGSRCVTDGQVCNWSWHRLLLSRFGNLYTRMALGIGVLDATGGFRAFRTDALHRIDLDGVQSQGYCFQVELLWRALQAGLRVTEMPIVFTQRLHGASKMSAAIVAESLLRVTRWGAQRRLRQLQALLHGRPLPSLHLLSGR